MILRCRRHPARHRFWLTHRSRRGERDEIETHVAASQTGSARRGRRHRGAEWRVRISGHVRMAAGRELLVSGRLVDEGGKPIAGAWVSGAAGVSQTHTDGDGRFMLKIDISGEQPYVEYGSADPRSSARRVRVDYREAPARFQRDERGVWRTTVTLTAA
jgi:hypothetical protein